MDCLDGVLLNPLKIIENDKGNIFHALKCTDPSYSGFGEAYFSAIKKNEIKGWKQHTEMTLNLIVPVGDIKFVLFDERPTSTTKGKFWEIEIGKKNYQRLTIPPQIWLAFQGLDARESLLLNIANILHNPTEGVNKALNELDYEWYV